MAEKLRNSFIVKIGIRNKATKERINKWLDAQENYTASVILVIEHMIEQFGYVDVTDYETAKKLYKRNIQSKLATNIDSLIHDVKEETKTETPVIEKHTETTNPVANENQTIIIEIHLQNKVLLIRDGSEKELSYKF